MILRKLADKILSCILSTDAGPAYTALRKVVNLTNNTLIDLTTAPPAGQIVVVDDIIVAGDASVTLDIKEEASATLLDRHYVTAGYKAQVTPRDFLVASPAVAAKKVQAQLSGNANVTVVCNYHFETP